MLKNKGIEMSQNQRFKIYTISFTLNVSFSFGTSLEQLL